MGFRRVLALNAVPLNLPLLRRAHTGVSHFDHYEILVSFPVIHFRRGERKSSSG